MVSVKKKISQGEGMKVKNLIFYMHITEFRMLLIIIKRNTLHTSKKQNVCTW